MEEATERHFYFHGRNALEHEKRDCHWCQMSSFPKHKDVPITLINDIDDAVLPSDFRFIRQNILCEGVKPADDNFRSGCSCASDCRYERCKCQDEPEDEPEESNDSDSDSADELKYAYHTRSPKAGLLRSNWLESSNGILYECHQSCSCSLDVCPNRVIERGRTIPLQIFRTKDRGWGVRSTENIMKGQFIDRYFGEVITAREAKVRRDAAQDASRKDVYLFGLDKFTDEQSFDPRLRGDPLEVDGEFASGPTRFINHSCDPNLRIFTRVGDHADKHLHDLALFATKSIPRGVELTFDYAGGIEGENDDFDQDIMTQCLCGSQNCRKFIW